MSTPEIIAAAVERVQEAQKKQIRAKQHYKSCRETVTFAADLMSDAEREYARAQDDLIRAAATPAATGEPTL